MQIIDEFLRKVIDIRLDELSEDQVESQIEELRANVKTSDNMYIKELLVK